jgi:tartrate dehydratase alpha subunit/fumarate hydratase class I-like protein
MIGTILKLFPGNKIMEMKSEPDCPLCQDTGCLTVWLPNGSRTEYCKCHTGRDKKEQDQLQYLEVW